MHERHKPRLGKHRHQHQAHAGYAQCCFGRPGMQSSRLMGNMCTDFFGSYWLANTDELENRVYVQWGTAAEYSNYDDSAAPSLKTARMPRNTFWSTLE